MNIVFKELHINNFLSLGEVHLQLDELGFVQVFGTNNCDNTVSNGSGKSSLFEAILWCVTGNTSRGTRSVNNLYSSGGTEVSLQLLVDDNIYEITRYREHKKYKNNLFVKVNGEDKSGKGLRESDKILQELLPNLSTDLLSSIMIIGQGMPNKFSSNSPSNRKLLLEQLTNQDSFVQVIRDKINIYKEKLQEQLNNLKIKLCVTEEKQTSVESQIEQYTTKLSEYTNIDLYKKQLLEIQNKIKELQEQEESYSTQTKDIEIQLENNKSVLLGLQDEFMKNKNEQVQLKDKVTSPLRLVVKDLLQDFNVLNSKIKEAESVPDICPLCKQKIHNRIDTSQYRAELQEIQGRIELEQKKITELEEVYNTEIENLEQQFNSSKIELTEKINNDNKILNQLNILVRQTIQECTEYKVKESKVQSFISSFSSQQKLIQDFIATKTEELQKLKEEKSTLPKEIEEKEKALQACILMDQIARKEYRNYLLSDTITFLNHICKKYSMEVFDTEGLEFSLEDQNIYISYMNKEYECLSGGEKQKVDLIIQFAIKQLLTQYYSINTNLIVLDEIFDNLDITGCNKVIDLITNELSDVSSVFIVSHRQDLQIPYDKLITVIKNPDGISSINT